MRDHRGVQRNFQAYFKKFFRLRRAVAQLYHQQP